jgi:L-aspartate-L-methionine ligase
MKALSPVNPSATFSHLFPSQVVFAPRSTMHFVRWVLDDAFRLDTITGVTLAIMGDMPLICHQNAATPLILDFFRQAGLEPASNIETYETEKEAVALARKHISRGEKIAYIYPPPLSLQESVCMLVPIPLYNWLNNKANLAQLIDQDHLPRYQIFQTDCLNLLYDFLPGQDVFIKACHPGAAGAGKDVRYCPNQTSRKSALDWLNIHKDGLSAVRIEEALDITDCWCLSLAIFESGIQYLGAAIQLFTEPAKQSGSRIDPDHLPPDSVVAIAKDIAQRSHDMGYCGFAGFDIGVTSSGQIFVFDLNFRLVSSTPQVLLHEAAINRVEARISQSWSCTVKGALAPVLKCIAKFSQKGEFVPTRLYEATQISGGKSVITGMVVASTLDEVESITDNMQETLGIRWKVKNIFNKILHFARKI